MKQKMVGVMLMTLGFLFVITIMHLTILQDWAFCLINLGEQ
jgi:hypothetical protein